MGKVTIETRISLIAAILYKNFHFLHALDLLLTSRYQSNIHPYSVLLRGRNTNASL